MILRYLKPTVLLIFIGLNPFLSTAQHATGLADDDAAYDTTSTVLMSSSKGDLPRNVSLKPYCPMPGNQGQITSCVGWSVGYGLLTIEKAIQNNDTDTRHITEQAYSAMFIYNQIKGAETNCKARSSFSDAFDFLKNKGNCLAREFDFKVEDCYIKPDNDLKERAYQNTIFDYQKLFEATVDGDVKVDRIRKLLAQKKPVSVSLRINDQFMSLKETDYWNPNLGKEPAEGHAMVVVGYDDDAACFTLLNSWGKVWGREGYIKVRYRDMGEFCRYAFVMLLTRNGPPMESLVMTDAGIERRNTRQGFAASQPTRQDNQPPMQTSAQPPRTTAQPPMQAATQPPRQNTQSPTQAATQSQKQTTQPPLQAATQPQKQSNQAPIKVVIAEQKPPKTVVPDPIRTQKPPQATEQPKPKPNLPQPQQEEEKLGNRTPRDLVEMSGSFEVNYFTGKWTTNKEPIFEALGVAQSGNHYTLLKKDWRLGDAFQLALTSKISGAYVYIISVNPRNEAKIMFPRNEEFGQQYRGLYESPLMMLDGARAVLPNPNKVIKVDYVGTDRICILFSTRKIWGFPKFCQKMQNWNGDFDAYFHKLLGNIMIPTSDCDFSPDKVAFSTSTRSEGSIVPIVIEFHSQ
jgi:hypothetical protein